MGKIKPIRFEQAIEQLEQIIDGIESGDIGLEDSLAQYEKGMKLIAQCRAILAAAEKRIADLTSDEKGGLSIAGTAEEAEGPAGPEDAGDVETADPDVAT